MLKLKDIQRIAIEAKKKKLEAEKSLRRAEQDKALINAKKAIEGQIKRHAERGEFTCQITFDGMMDLADALKDKFKEFRPRITQSGDGSGPIMCFYWGE